MGRQNLAMGTSMFIRYETFSATTKQTAHHRINVAHIVDCSFTPAIGDHSDELYLLVMGDSRPRYFKGALARAIFFQLPANV